MEKEDKWIEQAADLEMRGSSIRAKIKDIAPDIKVMIEQDLNFRDRKVGREDKRR